MFVHNIYVNFVTIVSREVNSPIKNPRFCCLPHVMTFNPQLGTTWSLVPLCWTSPDAFAQKSLPPHEKVFIKIFRGGGGGGWTMVLESLWNLIIFRKVFWSTFWFFFSGWLWKLSEHISLGLMESQLAITRLKLTIETLEQSVKFVQS